MMKHLKSVIALTVICAVVAVLMAATNMLTAPIIEANESAAANDALLVVMPNGSGFELVDTAEYSLPSTVTDVYREASGGYVIKLTTTGYSSGMTLMIGIDANGVVTGTQCLASGETLGYEKTWGENVVGATVDTVDSLDTVSGATKTTLAYKNAVKDALNTAVILGGGSVDIRTDEEILLDNLLAVLPDADGFETMFISEVVDGVDTVYEATNGSGYVYAIGESYVGLNANGEVVSEADEAIKETAANAYAVLSQSNLTEIDITDMELPSQVAGVSKTDSGNYVIDLKASGYGITGDKYSKSGEYIYIKVSVTPDGTIICCETVSQAETDGIGSACADYDFYSSFNGKTEDNYDEVDAISGATKTTTGYKTAIGKVYEVVKIMEGGSLDEN